MWHGCASVYYFWWQQAHIMEYHEVQRLLKKVWSTFVPCVSTFVPCRGKWAFRLVKLKWDSPSIGPGLLHSELSIMKYLCKKRLFNADNVMMRMLIYRLMKHWIIEAELPFNNKSAFVLSYLHFTKGSQVKQCCYCSTHTRSPLRNMLFFMNMDRNKWFFC